ncbi:Telomere length regulation protein [Cordyceps fumosorosea ARSEF 2679]|uniref:Telomere length regulation protein n=1 Tax=Cordyceps fumosorosea (strain ARSEF 2679) TaxID=1081104 RepID=A0A167ZJN0_CORFA|nr:Telomere length regulation protein [Cordyceps fumosorosea ARSEF 2679]OAA67597.1 Telomere length regulation protein [Cordyceps fumosorosea ARSEF 2679]
MDDFFTPVSTTYLTSSKENAQPVAHGQTAPKKSNAGAVITSLDEAVELLKSQPDYHSLISSLQFLCDNSDTITAKPSPQSAAVIHLLVTEITPNYWTLLLESSASSSDGSISEDNDASLLLRSLSNVAGLNATVAHINSLLVESRQRKKDVSSQDIHLHLQTFLDVTASLLRRPGAIRQIWTESVLGLPDAAMRKLQSQTLNSLLASSRVLSTASEASSVIGVDRLKTTSKFITDGAEYVKWIATNIASWAQVASTDLELRSCYDILQRSMSLGYQKTLVQFLIDELLLRSDSNPATFAQVCFAQPATFKKVMQILLDYLAHKFLNSVTIYDESDNKKVASVAGIINTLIEDDPAGKSFLISWCTSSSGAGLGDGIGIRRAVLASLAADKDAITAVLEKSLNQFGDQLYIKHMAILQQEVHAQILLLSAGYVFRLSPISLTMLVKSGTYMNSISNRIASTQERTRLLGMVVGEALSSLVYKDKTRLNFHMDEMETEEIESLKSLINVSDSIGPFDDLREASQTMTTGLSSSPPQKQKSKPIKKKPVAKAPTATSLPRAIIEELNSSSDEDDGLVPYAKGSDPEDSEDDAELVQRNKVKAPVYIRDLISYLRDVEDYDKQKLALQTAPTLIRRKANYGTEVKDHAEELAGILVGLQDKFELKGFSETQLEGMVALMVAQPRSMTPWFTRTFFDGDYSLSQRTAILISIGLASREVAGFDTGTFKASADFPSKQLPEKIQQLYLDANPDQEASSSGSHLKALPPNAIEAMSQALTADFLAPLAATAADAATGPDVLKLQSFTARHKRKTNAAVAARPRVRAVPNTAAALIAQSFFAPLTAHLQAALGAAASRRRAVVLQPALLALYLQTLGIVVGAAGGPATLALPQMTAELWTLLLGVRVHALESLGALRGWLIALAALLQVNDDGGGVGGSGMRRLCEDHGRDMFETREWVAGVFERIRGDDAAGEENDVKMLAAGVLIKLGEAVERYQALLMGDMASFS